MSNTAWKEFTPEDWANAVFCDVCGLPLLEIEPEEGEIVGEMMCVYCTWQDDYTHEMLGKVSEVIERNRLLSEQLALATAEIIKFKGKVHGTDNLIQELSHKIVELTDPEIFLSKPKAEFNSDPFNMFSTSEGKK